MCRTTAYIFSYLFLVVIIIIEPSVVKYGQHGHHRARAAEWGLVVVFL